MESTTKQKVQTTKQKKGVQRIAVAAVLFVQLLTVGCGLRTVPPIRYLPLLGKEKEVKTTQLLSRALMDRDLAVRAHAVKLLDVLSQSNDDKMKKQVARVLGIASRDSDPGIRLQAIESLGKMEAKFGNKYLHAALKDPNPFVRERVMQVLNERQAQLPDSSS
jgi:hypothetical protein